ncbi:Signal transduction histidine kinase [Paramicrobacterium humi]|uniref:histidine kinase n=1 Tax=Paramicrobacterium humi TaxID=640635 RepID=A0A1H4LE62_9MICO|nr:sensor histidine kinase [Microbacterium humi]SEB68974.1 Signal transduction histidine kinase [Microbacterium humi]
MPLPTDTTTSPSPESMVTMTSTDAATRPPASADASAFPNRYLRLWRRVPRELGYLLPLLPITVVGLTVALTLFSLGAGTIVLVVGLPIIVASLYVARGFGAFELMRLDLSGFPPIPRPRWPHTEKRGLAGILAMLADPHAWLALVHTMIVAPVIGILSWTVAFAWTTVGIAGATQWIYGWFLPEQNDGNLLEWVSGGAITMPDRYGDMIAGTILGILFLATLPFVTRALTALGWGVARVMLGSFSSTALREQVTELAESRTAAVAAEGTALRRLERDIHDGPQQRLVRLQMDLAAAERALERDPDAARELLTSATQQSREALEELRGLSRGFAPPLLLDRGLVAALESLAARSTVPTRLESTLPPETRLPLELERNAYFIAAEALTNVAKHSGARSALVRLALGEADAAGRRWLEVTVVDDGRGGAASVPGHGLAGLEERSRGLGGTLAVWSPAGGSTTVSAHLPA